MILPGVSGGYLLLLLGQYERILGAVDMVKQSLLGGLDLGSRRSGGGPGPPRCEGLAWNWEAVDLSDQARLPQDDEP